LPLAVAAGASQHFGHHLVEVLLPGCGCSGHFIAVGVAVPVPTMGAGDQIIVPQSADGPHRDGFLAG